MALKRKLDKAGYDALVKELQAEYKVDPKDPNVFTLDAEPDEDTGALKRAKAAEKSRADKLAEDKAALQAEYDAKLAELDGTSKDFKELKDKTKGMTKLEKDLADLQARDIARTEKLQAKETLRVRGENAQSLAEKLVGKEKAALMLPHIKERLGVAFDDEGEPTLQIFDKAGKVSTTTLADLEKEFRQDKTFSGIVVASKASGGGAPSQQGNPQNGGGAPAGGLPNQAPANFAKMDPKLLRSEMDARVQARRDSLGQQ